MMVGDNEINTKPRRRLGGSEGAVSHAPADNEANPRRCGAFNHVIPKIVAFANTVRNMEVSRTAAELNCGLQDDDRHRAVHVVVAVNQDGLLPFDGCVQAVNGGANAGHLFRWMEMGKRGSEEARSGFRVGDTAAVK